MNKELKPKIQFIYVENEVLSINNFKETLFDRYRLDFKTFQILEIGFRTIMSNPLIKGTEQRFGGYIYEYLFDNDSNPLTEIYKQTNFTDQLELIEITLMNFEGEHDIPFGVNIVGEIDFNYDNSNLRKALKFNLGHQRRAKLPPQSTTSIHPNIADYLTEYIHNSYIYWGEVFKYYFDKHNSPPVPDFIAFKLKHEHLNEEYLLTEEKLDKFYKNARIRDKIEDVKYSPKFIERTKHILKGPMGTKFIKSVVDWEKGE